MNNFNEEKAQKLLDLEIHSIYIKGMPKKNVLM